MGWIIVLAVLIVIIIAVVISIYNNLVKYRNKVKNAWANVDTQLQRRFDLIPNLVEVVQTFITQEMRVISNLLDARKLYESAVEHKDKLAISDKLARQLKELYEQLDNYPDVKSNNHFLQLQTALTEVESDITYARQFYNDAVTMYNDRVMKFPASIIASLFGFKEEVLFVSAGTAQSQQIKFKHYVKYTNCPQCGAPVTDGIIQCTHCNCKLI